jgi:GDP-4-dehydro-6-deoxy-D-mannose reductase
VVGKQKRETERFHKEIQEKKPFEMKVLITGITGFAGSHLADYCVERGDEVHGTNRWRSNLENIIHLNGKIRLHECDLTDSSAVRSVIREVNPEWVFHLAAQSYVHSSWKEPSYTLNNNITSELNLLEALKGSTARIQIAGSSEEYGEVDKWNIPISEDAPLNPLSPYAVSKIAQDFLGFQYFKSYGMEIVRTRAFNHTGPRRSKVFATSTFAKQIAEIEKGKEPIIYVGNLKAKRDFTDVRDMVRGYYLALKKGESGEVYNICSGKTHSMHKILEMLLSFTDRDIEIKQDPERMRPSDVPILLGDSSAFRVQTGWKPEIPIRETLKDLLNYWRERC